MHVHISTLTFLIFLLHLLIAGFVLRTLATRLADHPIGKAIAYVY